MPHAQVSTTTTTLRLSDTVEVTLTVSGSAPLRVELSKELLAPDSAVGWQIEPVGSAELSADSATWVQVFRLSPFVPGEMVPLTFNPVTVNGVQVTPDPLKFTVETSLRNPTANDARPVTSVEQLPPKPSADSPLIFAGLSLLTALVTVLVTIMLIACKRKPKPLTPAEWVREQVTALQSDRQQGRITAATFVGMVAEVFREYLTRRFGLNTEQKTTAELLQAAEAEWNTDTLGEVTNVLAVCDEVKYAGLVPGPNECDDLAIAVEGLVMRWENTPPHTDHSLPK